MNPEREERQAVVPIERAWTSSRGSLENNKMHTVVRDACTHAASISPQLYDVTRHSLGVPGREMRLAGYR